MSPRAAEIVEDNYFFGVQAIDKDGNVSVATYPTLALASAG
jgi:hypothetical protein